MLAIHMGDFMGQNSRQFGFILNQVDQPLIDIDIPSGSGEGVDGRTPDDREFVFERGLIAVGEYPLAQGG